MCRYINIYIYGGTPRSSISIGFSIINQPAIRGPP